MLIEGIHNEPIHLSHALARSAIFAYHQQEVEVGRVMAGEIDYQQAYWEGAGWEERPLPPTPLVQGSPLRLAPRLEGDSRRCPLQCIQGALDHQRGKQVHPIMHCCGNR